MVTVPFVALLLCCITDLARLKTFDEFDDVSRSDVLFTSTEIEEEVEESAARTLLEALSRMD